MIIIETEEEVKGKREEVRGKKEEGRVGLHLKNIFASGEYMMNYLYICRPKRLYNNNTYIKIPIRWNTISERLKRSGNSVG